MSTALDSSDQAEQEAFRNRMLRDGSQPIRLQVDVLTAWALLSILQWAARQPALGRSLACLYRAAGADIEQQLPAWLQPLAAKGWLVECGSPAESGANDTGRPGAGRRRAGRQESER